MILKLAGTTSKMKVGAPFIPDKTVQMPCFQISLPSRHGDLGHVWFAGMSKDLHPELSPEDLYLKIPGPANAAEDLLRASMMICGMQQEGYLLSESSVLLVLHIFVVVRSGRGRLRKHKNV